MAGFVASERVEQLAYDFTVYRPDPGEAGISEDERNRRHRLAELPWQGVTPEPDEPRMREFFAAVADVNLESAEQDQGVIDAQVQRSRARWQDRNPGKDLPNDEEIELTRSAAEIRADMAELARARVDSRGATHDRFVAVVAEFCQDRPPREVLAEVPFRGLQMYVGWLTGQFSPEALAAATNG